MSDQDAQVIVDTAQNAVEPTVRDPDEHVIVVAPNGAKVHELGPVPDSQLVNPRRRRGTTLVHDAASLAAVWGKHRTDASELYADLDNTRIVGVLNADEAVGGKPDHRDHLVVLDLQPSTSWARWMAHDGDLMTQVKFAELIEDRLIDVVEPSGADMLELAQHFEASSTAEFKSGQPLADGSKQLVFTETINARAGETGQLAIPSHFVLGIQPFKSGPAFKIKARLRYRIRNGVLAIGYALERPEDSVKEAFAELVTEVGEACSIVPLMGTAPAAVR